MSEALVKDGGAHAITVDTSPLAAVVVVSEHSRYLEAMTVITAHIAATASAHLIQRQAVPEDDSLVVVSSRVASSVTAQSWPTHRGLRNHAFREEPRLSSAESDIMEPRGSAKRNHHR
ncbi:hypothetical protein LQ757_04580 [Agromyces sp. SYSU K20354]|uniref:hypothetical protein n=1 Tax=Agromyces cavernae TaxID=2898659 RepID=UPI001E2863A7|nr:hypothetical protein [Agromyces cavernae]MCD2441550.1 hypothetical protein [Agromyces cavernae]